MNPHGLMFHHFKDDRHKGGQGSISAEVFAHLLMSVGLDRILSASEWCNRANEGTLKQEDLCITFDDSLLCQFDIAVPVLEHFNKTAFWFVYSSVFQGVEEPFEIYRYFRTTQYANLDDFYDEFFDACSVFYPELTNEGFAMFGSSQYLSAAHYYSDADRRFRFFRDEVLGPTKYHALMAKILTKHQVNQKDLSADIWMTDEHLKYLHNRGHEIGLHSYTHPTRLSNHPIVEQKAEYERNALHLTQVLGRVPRTMSHPNNSYSADTLNLLTGMGITVGFRADMTLVNKRSNLEFAREDHANLIRNFGISC
ncbi:MAG: polysaccharide deacetylase family protein [Candidatus Saccharibacteria bacterium]|nr:polysaccharide deacetylase family protein [Moraxellaceae bacterium]